MTALTTPAVSPEAFTGPFAVTAENLWLMLWQPAALSGMPQGLQQWLVLANPGEAGRERIRQAAEGVGKLVLAVNLSQMRAAQEALASSEEASATCLPEWMPLIKHTYVLIGERNEEVFAATVRARSPVDAMEAWAQQNPGATLLGCGGKQDVEQASAALEGVLQSQDIRSVRLDLRTLSGKDPLWLYQVSSPQLTQQYQ